MQQKTIKNRLLSLFIYFAILCSVFSNTVKADAREAPSIPPINCYPLMPSNTPSEDIRMNAQLNADALYKKIISGEFKMDYEYNKQDLLINIPNADQVIIAQLTAYLLCESIKTGQNGEALLLFINNILPKINNNNNSKVLEIDQLPEDGEIELKELTEKYFNKGNIIISVLSSTSDGIEEVEVEVAYKDKNGEIIRTEGKRLKKKGAPVKYKIGDKKFSLEFDEYFEGNESFILLVKTLK